MKEADGDGRNVELAEAARGSPDGRLVEGQLDAAVEAHALRHLDAQPARHQRRRILDAQVEQVVAALEAHIENVAEARRRQHAGDGAAALDHRVGDERRAMHDIADVADGDALLAQQGLDAGDDRLGGIVRRGQPLVHGHPATTRIEQRKVGERPADVDADAIHAPCPILVLRQSSTCQARKEVRSAPRMSAARVTSTPSPLGILLRNVEVSRGEWEAAHVREPRGRHWRSRQAIRDAIRNTKRQTPPLTGPPTAWSGADCRR